MGRNILLTTLGNTFDYDRHSYFTYNDNGLVRYCEGISNAEAGAKYILSKVSVDKIIVLGPSSAVQDENIEEEISLRDYCGFSAAMPEMYSEYKFFCYRIMQFINHIDIEGTDLLESISDFDRQMIMSILKTYCNDLPTEEKESRKIDQLFFLFNQYTELFEHLLERIPNLDKKKKTWLKHYLYMRMNRSHKMSTLDQNEDIKVQFVPTVPKDENNLRMGNLPTILDSIMEGNRSEINVYVDLQGMDIADSHTLINVLFMLQNEKGKRINIQEIIMTTYRPSLFTNPIENQKNRLELSELLSGMDAFLQFGKVDSIRRYWDTRNIKDEHVEKLIYAMQTVDVGITLCSVSELEQGIRMLKMVFADEQKSSDAIESMIFSIMENAIRYDYGNLLNGEEINILALVRWAMNKHFYQQALTIIESRVPHDLVTSGIFYYARDEKELEEYLLRVNEAYWAVQPKDRYQFDDMEHYFVKFYRRREAYRKKPKIPIEGFLKLRLDEIYNEDSKVKSYTLFQGERETLHQFLLTYMQIGNIRNQISHAQEVNLSYEEWSLDEQNEKIRILQNTIGKFVDLYTEVKEMLDPDGPKPYLISQDDFKAYCKDHAISWDEMRLMKEQKRLQEAAENNV